MVGRGNAIASNRQDTPGRICGLARLESGPRDVSWLDLETSLLVICQWFWNYVRHTRQSRLITGDPEVHIKTLRRTSRRLQKKHQFPQ